MGGEGWSDSWAVVHLVSCLLVERFRLPCPEFEPRLDFELNTVGI